MNNPGGLECHDCGAIFIGQETELYCPSCVDNRNERAHDRAMSEPTFRGGEYAASVAAEQARIQRELK
jgi:hypothetical protein